MNQNSIFKDKTILVTGHTGFIGSWLCIWLNELGGNIIGYALPPYTPNDNFVISKLDKRITSIIGDIRDYDKLADIFKKYEPEIIYHLAAQPLVRESYLNPKETYDINICGTVNVFEIFRKSDFSRILINFTTDKCYENIESNKGYCEDDRLGGYDPYSSSKACSELITQAYRKSFFTKEKNIQKSVSSVRAGNVIGGGDWQKDRLIPDTMRAIRNSDKIIIRNPDAVRPWQYVLEPINGILVLTEKMMKDPLDFSGAWNFGPNDNLFFTVNDITKMIINYMGLDENTIQYSQNPNELHETKILLLDNTKAKKYLGWKPQLDIKETIKYLCEWYMEKNVDYVYDVQQIKNYTKKFESTIKN